MILENIYLKNIRSYKEINIDLTPGISLFSGDVGSGKSTILMAIEFAFFGLGNQRGDSLLKKDKNSGEVELTFNVEGNQGIIKRVLQRNESTGNITQGKGTIFYKGEKLELSPAELKEMILDIIDFKEDINPRSNSHIFRYAVYTPQEEMKDIINQRPDERMQTLRKAFGIEDYKTTIENAEHLIKSLKNKRLYYKGKLEMYGTVESEMVEGKQIINELAIKLDELEEMIKIAKANFDLVQNEKENALKIKSEIEKWEIELKHSKTDKENIMKRISALTDDLEDLKRYMDDELLTRLNHLKEYDTKSMPDLELLESKRDEVAKLLDDKFVLKTDKDVIKKQISVIDEEMGEFKDKSKRSCLTGRNKVLKVKAKTEEELLNLNEELSDIDGDIKINQSEQRRAKKRLDQLREDLSKCPLCESDLNDDKRESLIKSIKDEIKQYKKYEVNLKQIKDELTNNRNKLLKKAVSNDEKWNKWNNLLKNADKKELLLKDLEKIKEDLKAFELPIVELGDYTKGCSNLKECLEKINKEIGSAKEIELNLKRLDETKANIKHTTEKIEWTEKELKTEEDNLKIRLDFLEDQKEIYSNLTGETNKYDEIMDKYDNLKGQLDGLVSEEIQTKTLLNEKTEQTKYQNKKLDELNKLSILDIDLEEKILWIEGFFVNAIKLVEKNILSELYHELNENFRKWFEILVDDETKSARLDLEFTPIVEQGQIEQDINFLSGGEKTSIALAYRLALNKLVKKVSVGMESNLLILDEPTDGLSKDQLLKLREILDEMECSQIILVSHEREIENFADHVVEIEKINGISRIKEEI